MRPDEIKQMWDSIIGEWATIPGYGGRYKINREGRVVAAPMTVMNKSGKPVTVPGKVLRQTNSHGYLKVALRGDGGPKQVLVHRLLAQAFLPEWDPDLVVDHLDGNKLNNSIENLEMCTSGENTARAWALGLIPGKERKRRAAHIEQMAPQ